MKIVSRLECILPRWLAKGSNNLQSSPLFLSRLCSSSASHYETLNVPRTASQQEIKKAFFEKSKKFHPDVSPGNSHYHKVFVKLNNAYSILGDKSKRKEYDQSLKPKSKIYNSYQSSENLHRYRNHSFYYASDQGFTNRTSARPKNYKVALAIILFMSTGVAFRLMWIWYKHKQYKKQLDLNSMKASKLYQESRERSSKYTMEEQLKMLAERQGKIERKRS